MTRATFFKHFELLADQPDAAARMRELVLELAVRGKLVSNGTQSDKDPTWIEFCSELDDRSDEISPAFDVPAHWRWTRIENVAAPCGQKKPDAKFTYVDVGAIDNVRGVIKDDIEIIAPEDAPSRARKLVALNSVIYSTVRPYLRNIAIVDRKFSPPAIVSTAFAVLHPKSFIDSRYLFYWLRSQSFQKTVESKMKGVAYPAISDSEFWGCLMPVPPLSEQRRIVAKVDELMALCDELAARQQARHDARQKLQHAALQHLLDAREPATFATGWQRVRDHFHQLHETPDSIPQLRQAILQLAVTGRLLAQDPKDEPTKNILEQVLLDNRKERLKRGDKTEKQPVEQIVPRMEDLPVLPSSWEWVYWESVLAFGKDSFKRGPFGSSITKSMFVPSGYKVYEQYCPINDDCSFARYFITPEKFKQLEGFAVRARDFLISCSGVTLGRITQVPDKFDEGVINQAILRVRTNKKLLDDAFFKMLFRSPYFQEQIFSNSTGSAIPNVKGVSELKAIPLPIPPLAEQKRIVARVEELMRQCDALEAQLNQSQTLGTRLLDAFVRKMNEEG